MSRLVWRGSGAAHHRGARPYKSTLTCSMLCLGLALCMMSARSEAQPRSSLESKVSEMRLKLERSPSDHQVRLNLSKYLNKLRRYEEALATIEPLATLSEPPQPVELKALFYKAFFLRKLRRHDEAIRLFQVFIKRSSDTNLKNQALFFLAKSLESKGDPVGASERYQAFLQREKRPQRANLIKAAQQALSRLKEVVVPIERGGPEVEVEETKSAQASPPPAAQGGASSAQGAVGAERAQGGAPRAPRENMVAEGAQVTLAQADQMFGRGEYKAASEAYRALSQRNPPNKMVYANLLHRASVSAFLAGAHRDAQVDAERALSAQPDSAALRRTLKGLAVMSVLMDSPAQPSRADARLAIQEGRFEDGLQLTRRLLESEGEDPELRRYEGKSLMGLGRPKEALAALKRAEKAGRHPYLSLEIAQAAERAGDVKVASRAYQVTLKSIDEELRPHSALARLATEGLERLQGR